MILWIDRIRRYGIMSSFVESRNIKLSEQIKEIKYILDKLKDF